MTTPLSPERLTEIEAVHDKASRLNYSRSIDRLCVAAIPVLLAEVRRLQADLDHAMAQRAVCLARIAELEKQVERFVEIVTATDTAASMAAVVDYLAAARARITALEADVLRLTETGRAAAENWMAACKQRDEARAKSDRHPLCQCHQEAGDSTCEVHGVEIDDGGIVLSCAICRVRVARVLVLNVGWQLRSDGWRCTDHLTHEAKP